MPTCSTSAKRSHWAPSKALAPNTSSANNMKVKQTNKYPATIRHISAPNALGSTSAALLHSVSLASGAHMDKLNDAHLSVKQDPAISGSAYLSISSSSSSLQPDLNTSTSKTRLHEPTASLNSLTGRPATAAVPLSIKRQVNLKHIKTIIIALLAVDLLITVFVHQFSSQDQLSFSLFQSSFRLRLSLLNLLLTAIWFILLIGAILFDWYAILLVSCLLEISSFFVLLGFSINHFGRRIDYNTVQLTSLLALLFAVVILHVYLLVAAGLMVYLTLAVKRRRQPTTSTSPTCKTSNHRNTCR